MLSNEKPPSTPEQMHSQRPKQRCITEAQALFGFDSSPAIKNVPVKPIAKPTGRSEY